jgi:hypothetical protein
MSTPPEYSGSKEKRSCAEAQKIAIKVEDCYLSLQSFRG